MCVCVCVFVHGQMSEEGVCKRGTLKIQLSAFPTLHQQEGVSFVVHKTFLELHDKSTTAFFQEQLSSQISLKEKALFTPFFNQNPHCGWAKLKALARTLSDMGAQTRGCK